MGDHPYEEYVLILQELKVLKNQNSSAYMMLWELVYHFHLSIDVIGLKRAFV